MAKRLQNGEPIADIRVTSAEMLIGTTIAGMEVPTMIDELPIWRWLWHYPREIVVCSMLVNSA